MKVSGRNLSMTRGDTESLTVYVKDHPFETGDTVFFTVRPKVYGPIVLQKIATSFVDGKAEFNIDPSDTEGLPFGTYVYDVQWTQADGTVITIVKPAIFAVTEEVTYG